MLLHVMHERADLQHERRPQPPPAQRTRQILEELRQQGRVVAAELARRYAVSEDSIRRDLRELAQGLCQRVYGGAVLPPPKERRCASA
jgi:DeoR/GlpR family transcriptional regulator of sugar metabolism